MHCTEVKVARTVSKMILLDYFVFCSLFSIYFFPLGQGPTLFEQQKYIEFFLVADNREVRAGINAPNVSHNKDLIINR